MPIPFTKYHGAGNDFIMIDQREKTWIQRTDKTLVAQMCHRRFGIGGDGLILLQHHEVYGVEMVYFNSDGGESTLCGNGGRCFTAFAKYLGLTQEKFRFLAIDGPHGATIPPALDGQSGHDWVELHMNDVINIERLSDTVFVLNTGSPHYISFVSDLQEKDMVAEGRAIRYSDRFKDKGINVNLVASSTNDSLSIRTYERGVEDETLACGTGVTAAALAYSLRNGLQGNQYIPVSALGGDLGVRLFATDQGKFTDIWLCGPAQKVYEGLY
jgi:diaminopimelate epimerase